MIEQPEFAAVSLPNNVQDAMRDNLPQQVSKILREELAKGEAAQREAQMFLVDLNKAEILLDEHGEIKSARRGLEKEAKNLAEREKQLDAIELGQKLLMAEHRFELQCKYSDRLEAVLAGLVRNTEWRESIRDCSKTDGFDKQDTTNSTVTATKEAV